VTDEDFLVILVSPEGEPLVAAKEVYDALTKLIEAGAIHDFAIYQGPVVELVKEED